MSILDLLRKLFDRDPQNPDTAEAYIDAARSIDDMYEAELFRDASTDEFAEWMYWLVEEDMPVEEMRDAIRATDEWKEKHPAPAPGAPTIGQFVDEESPEVWDTFTAASGGDEPTPSDLGHNFWRRLSEGFSHRDVLHGIKGDPYEDGGITIPPGKPWWGDPPPVDYATFVQVEIVEVAQAYYDANHRQPGVTDLAFNTYRRLALFWTHRDVIHGIKGETLEDGGEDGARPEAVTRQGRVRNEGRSWVDDTGHFYPLGGTLFWAIRGWKYERERLMQNLDYLASYGFDYIRILADVGWEGNDVNSDWPDYEQLLGELLDCAYADYGLRAEITVWGGSDRDPLDVTDKVVRVVAGREHTILDLEAANESFQNGPDWPTIAEMVKRLATTGCIVAPSQPYSWDDAAIDSIMTPGTSLLTVHLDRTYGDLDWRFVRQPWDAKGFSWASSQNEPKGPQSSVSASSSPLQLTMNRAVGILCGAGAYVLHNSAGVGGVNDPNPAHPRPPNLWEMPGIDPIMKAIRALDEMLPPGVENWQVANNGWTPPNPQNPINATYLWGEGDGRDDGANKNYSAQSGADFLVMPCGVRGDGCEMTATWACHIDVYRFGADGLAVLDFSGPRGAGEVFTLPGTSDSLTAYVIRGRCT